MPFTFVKGHYLEIAFDREPDLVVVHDGLHQWATSSPSLVTTFVLPQGTYDVWAVYGYLAWVIRENVPVSGPTTLQIDRGEAVHDVTLSLRDQHGAAVPSSYKTNIQRLVHLPSGQALEMTSKLTPPLLRHFSDLSTDYAYEWRIDAVWQDAFYLFYDRMVGVDSDYWFQNAPQDLWHIEHHCHPPPGHSQLKLRYYLPYG
jgi:hypothetical protein